MALPSRTNQVRVQSRHVVRQTEPYLAMFGNSMSGLEVQHDYKKQFRTLNNAVIGRMHAAFPHGKAGKLDWIFRDIVVIPDRTRLVEMEKILRGKKPDALKQADVQKKIIQTYLGLEEHRKKVEARIKTEGKVPWHTT